MTFRWTASIAVAVALGFAAPASAAYTVSQSDSPDPVDAGATVSYSISLANTQPSAAELWLSTLTTKPGSDAAVGNPYVSIGASQGSCGVDPPDAYGYTGAECSFGTVAPGATVQVEAVVRADHSMDHLAALFDCEPGNPGCGPLQVDTERTTVIHPPVLTGSPKIAIRGLPAGCASSDFKAKAKAKPRKVRSIAVSLSGPRDEFGGLIDGVVSSSGRIAKQKGRKVKVPIDASTMEEGFYKLTFLALKKGGKLKRFVSFQVC